MKTNYEAGAHQAQMKILRQLLLSEESSFTDLCKVSGLSSDHCNFHIKKLIEIGYVAHRSKSYGSYVLTKAGKEYANRMDTDDNVIEKQPKLSVVLVIENEEGKHLIQQRLKQPYYGYWGRPTGKIRWGETMIEAGARELMEETGLESDMQVAGFYHKIDYSETGELLEDKYFCVIHGVNPRGELIVDAEGHHNAWLADDELTGKDKAFSSIKDIFKLVEQADNGVFERKYTYDANDY